MNNRWLAASAALTLGTLAMPGVAHAAKVGRVAIDNAQVLDKPGAGAKVVGTLPKGTVIATTDAPTGGFYRMKSRTGVTGYISARAVAFARAGAPKSAASAPRRAGGGGGSSEGTALTVRAIGALSMFNSETAIESISKVSGLSGGAGMGAEVGYRISGPIHAMARFETFSKSVKAPANTDAGVNYAYTIETSGTPIMAGLQYDFSEGEGLSVQGALFLGFGKAKLSATATADPSGTAVTSGNVTTFEKNTLTIFPKVNLNYRVSRNFSVLGELGYRIFKASDAALTVEGTGSDLFRLSSGGVFGAGAYGAVNPNLSGPVVGLGLGVEF